MARFAAFLRGVSPMNAKMPDLKAAFEAAGFKDVNTLLSSGNVVFSARGSAASLQRRAEAAMLDQLGRSFLTIIRPLDALRKILESDPYKPFRLKPGSRRIITFLREPLSKTLKLPLENEGARILAMQGAEVYSVYWRNPRGPVFMTLIEKTFGKDVTTRTWETVTKAAR
jgi:uncharacterized protein (DUF1697 family)